ncbi:MAG: nucleotide exchange factor GrpE [Nitrospinae bacterium]|nr:nucleotide exchange factor GrpE [Nitrospinota bacterium]
MSEDDKVEVRDKRRIKSVDDTCSDAPEADLERLPTFVDQLNEQMRQNDERLREYIAAHKERMAEVDQLRKRLEADVDNRAKARFGDLISALLPVMDDFDRALDHAKKANADEAILKGMGLLRDGLVKALTVRGLSVTDCAQKPFDPEVAQAVGVVEVEDAALDNIVMEQLTPGYVYEGRVLRPAMVRVGRKA